MPDLTIAPEARRDLRDIRRFSDARFGRTATESYAAGLRATFQRIADRPLAGKPEFDLAPGVRSVGYRSHRIYYQADPTKVMIVRILHHARDVTSAFDEQ